jgi:hypothetical protein
VTISTKDKALRMAFQVFYSMAHGATVTPEQAQLLANACAICLPMCHRFTRDELDALKVASVSLQ